MYYLLRTTDQSCSAMSMSHSTSTDGQFCPVVKLMGQPCEKLLDIADTWRKAHSQSWPVLDWQGNNARTTKTHREWRGRIRYNNKTPFLQVWFSSLLSPSVPTEFYLELEEFRVFPCLSFLILLYSQHLLSCSPLLSLVHSITSILFSPLYE